MSAQLTTRQLNALRLLLDKHYFSTEEVAAIDYTRLVRAPGIGLKGMEIIRAWLLAHGHDLRDWPDHGESGVRAQQTSRKLEQAIDLLTRHDYAVSKRA